MDLEPLSTQAALCEQWRRLMGPLGFGGRSLWVLFLDPDDRPTPMVTQVEQLPAEPDVPTLDRLMWVCGEVVREEHCGRVALLLSRPGRATVRADDLAWGRAVHAAAERAGVGVAPVHLATDEDVRLLAGDDLLETG